MKRPFLFSFLFGILVFIIISCKSEKDLNEFKPVYGGNLFIAIKNDIDFFNPLYSNDFYSGLINDLIFGALTYSEFNSDSGKLIYYPNLAKDWEISDDKKSIIYFLKTNLKWSDGVKFSSKDVYYSYILYTNPEVMSVRQDVERFFIHDVDGKLNPYKSFQILNDSTIKFNFSFSVEDPLFVTGLPILPEHIFIKIQKDKILTDEINTKPVGIGPFKLENYLRQQQIVLVRNDSAYYDRIPFIEKLVFKVVPDYNSRLNQLKNGEIDLMTDIRPEDAEILKNKFNYIRIEAITGRDYDYIGWNNLDNYALSKSKFKIIKPHPLFGDKEIRLALSMAINRQEILNGYFGEFANPAISPISPIFKNFLNLNLKPIPFNPLEAKKIFQKKGWKDTDGDGIIDKNGIPFRFKLTIPSGKPHREFAATIVKNDLKKIGIDVEIERLENSLFFSNLFERKLDAWIAGWTIPLDLDLEGFWGSDLNKNFFNVCGYQNPEVDKIFEQLKKANSFEEKRNLIFKFQEIIYSDQPVTFLYWIDNIIGYNKKLKNVNFNPVAYTNRIWEWFIAQ